MKLSGLNLHLTRQNKQIKQIKLNMTDPPTNERDFASLIKQHSRIINKVSYFYATDKLPFDDLRQEIYVNIWLGLRQFRGDSKMSTWIYRVAVNSALMALRSSKPKIETVSLDFGLLELSSEIDDTQRENLQTLQSLINRLEDIEKAIILLWLDGYSYDEIADTPSKLFSKTANIRLLMISGEVIFGMGLVILFTLLLPNAWEFNRTGFWLTIATLIIAIIYGIVHMWPQYIKLFRDLNSIKE